jgi:hypothetical protein
MADFHPTEFPSEWIGRIHNFRPSNPRHEQYTCPEQQTILRFVEQYFMEPVGARSICE